MEFSRLLNVWHIHCRFCLPMTPYIGDRGASRLKSLFEIIPEPAFFNDKPQAGVDEDLGLSNDSGGYFL